METVIGPMLLESTTVSEPFGKCDIPFFQYLKNRIDVNCAIELSEYN